MDLHSLLEKTEATAAAIRREIAAGPCREYGHDWKSYGWANAGCDLGASCGCSVPVNVCPKCSDCDYGDNAEANEIRKKCAEYG